MKEYTNLIVWAVIIGAAFAFAWKSGYLQRFSNYIDGTREELRKCSWPTREELKGSTILVILSVLMVGIFTAAVDLVVISAVRLII
ncbi:MAG: preprotein translocase subunit SecE [Verrucomicrobia bacterium]|nr:preprotein translocase subunit SecE [Verrucomicrobiota bacterium]